MAKNVMSVFFVFFVFFLTEKQTAYLCSSQLLNHLDYSEIYH